MVGYEHQIKYINDPVPVHVSLGLVGAEGLGNQCQVQDIHHPIAVDICWILRFHPQIHLPVEVRQRVLGVHQTAGDALRLFRQGDYLEGAAVIVDRPAVGVFADVETGDLFVELGCESDGLSEVRIPEVVPVVLVTLA